MAMKYNLNKVNQTKENVLKMKEGKNSKNVQK